MTVSSAITYNLTARQVIEYALHKLRVLGTGETATSAQGVAALLELNVMLKAWMPHRDLWRLTEASITLLASTYVYTLSPVPYRVVSARYRNSSSIDLPMRLMTREEYYNFPQKAGTGPPTQYYVDYQRDTVTLTTWQSLSAPTTETIPYTYQRKYLDVSTLDDNIDVRQEHLGLVGYNLAKRVGIDYGRAATPTYGLIAQEADRMLESFLDADREDEVRFVVGWR